MTYNADVSELRAMKLFCAIQVLWPKKGAFDNANDLKEQAFYRFIAKTYWGHIALQFAVLYAIGGMPWFVWLGCVRVGTIHCSVAASVN